MGGNLQSRALVPLSVAEHDGCGVGEDERRHPPDAAALLDNIAAVLKDHISPGGRRGLSSTTPGAARASSASGSRPRRSSAALPSHDGDVTRSNPAPLLSHLSVQSLSTRRAAASTQLINGIPCT